MTLLRQTIRPRTGTGRAVAVAGVLVAFCALAGWWLTARGSELHLGNTFPVTGRYQAHLSAWLLPPLLVAGAVWRAGPRLAARLPWPGVLLGGYLCAVVWAVALARVGGPDALTAPLTPPWEYLAEVDRIDAMGAGAYLRTFTDFIIEGPAGPGWANHVAGHPPLLALLFVLLARAGLAGPGWAAASCVAVGALAVPAVLSTVRTMAGEGWARRAAPYVAAAPLALWVATSADAIVAGAAAIAIALLAHAAARTGPVALWLAGFGGLLLGAVLMLSYGMALLSVVVLAVVVAVRGWRDAWPPFAAAAVGVAAVLAGFAAAGFWWFEGLGLTAERVRIGQGWSDRPTGYFVFANPAALAVAVGPAVVAAMALLWRARTRLVVPAAAALVALGLAIVSNLSKGEVERIWLPYAVWLLPLAALLPGAPPADPAAAPPAREGSPAHAGVTGPPARGWLAAHLAWPVLVAAVTTLSW